MSVREDLLDELFSGALALPAGEREAFLRGACGGDEALRERLRRLLRADAAAGEFLETPISAAVGEGFSGAQIGRYRLIEKIGEGGVGVVFKAEQSEPFRRTVALKLIKPGMDTREVIARFESERQALALMDHPGIARVFDAGATAGGRPYFVLELVPGLPITEFCDDRRLTLTARLELFIGVCRAIHHAHTRGVIHRDIKPANILVAWQDGAPAAKVIDFGIAKATEARLTDKTIFTALTHVMGTPAYMSPEQMGLATGDIDGRSDVYSLGVLLYELLAGNTPFDRKALVAAGIDEMRRRIREDEPPRPSVYLDGLDAEAARVVAMRRQTEWPQLVNAIRAGLEWIAMRCLEKDRALRFATAEALADDVARFLRGEPVTASPPSALARLKTYARAHTAARWLGATAAAALAGWRSARQAGNPIGEAALDAEVRAATRGRTRDVEAYRLFEQGRDFLDRLTKEDLKRAIACFQQAIARDEKFALAWVGLSMSHESLAKWGEVKFDEAFENARTAAARALAIEPALADAHVAAAKVQMGYDWDWRAAEKSLERALALAPANVHVWVAAAALAMSLGQRDRALFLGQRAVELDPGLFAAHQYLAMIHLVFGKPEEAEHGALRMLALSPDSELTHWILCVSALERGQLDRARVFAQDEKDTAFRLVLLGIVHHARGDATGADAALAELMRDHEAQASYQVAQVHAFRGHTDAAFVWLEWAYRRRDAGLGMTKIDPCLRNLHRDPRWGLLLRRLRLEN